MIKLKSSVTIDEMLIAQGFERRGECDLSALSGNVNFFIEKQNKREIKVFAIIPYGESFRSNFGMEFIYAIYVKR